MLARRHHVASKLSFGGSFIFFLFFGTIWSGLTLTFDTFIATSLRGQFLAGRFTHTTGTILASSVTTSTSSKGGTTHGVSVSYAYAVNGTPYTGTRYRWSDWNVSGDFAFDAVKMIPAGASVPVYYDPADPSSAVLDNKLSGFDFFMPMFMMPFNAVMLGLWLGGIGALLHVARRPIAGGLKVIESPTETRVRPGHANPLFPMLLGAGLCGFVLIFVVGFSTGMAPSLLTMQIAWGVVALVTLLCGALQLKANFSSAGDIVLDTMRGRVTLGTLTAMGTPKERRRKEPIELRQQNITDITTAESVTYGSKGQAHWRYDTILHWREGADVKEAMLHRFSDADKAESFRLWLAEKLRLAHQRRT